MAFSYSTVEVAQALRVSPNTLGRMRGADILTPGKHFIAIGASMTRPTFRWDLDAVEETMLRRSKSIKRPKLEDGRHGVG